LRSIKTSFIREYARGHSLHLLSFGIDYETPVLQNWIFFAVHPFWHRVRTPTGKSRAITMVRFLSVPIAQALVFVFLLLCRSTTSSVAQTAQFPHAAISVRRATIQRGFPSRLAEGN
jgi:hypothetical protein